MATTTRRLLRQYLSQDRRVGDWKTETTTGAGGAAGVSLVCTALIGFGDDYFNDWWVVLPLGPDGATTYEARQVSDFTSSTGTVTVSGYRSFSLQVDSTGTKATPFELHRWNPDWKHAALDYAGRYLAGRGLHLPISDRSQLVDGVGTNLTFQTYSSGFTGWSSVGTPTIAEETSRVLPGFSRSAKITASGAIEGLSQNLLPYANQDSIVGKTLHIRAWLFCGTASSMRVRLTFDGATYYSTDYVGANEWQGPSKLKIDQAIPSTLTEMTVSILVADGIAGYCQMVAPWIDTVGRYTVPSALNAVDKLYQQVGDTRTDDWEMVSFYNPPVSGRILKLVGRGVLTLPTSDTATMEVGDRDIPLVVTAAVPSLLGQAAAASSGEDTSRLLAEASAAEAQVERMLGPGRHGHHVYGSNRGGGAWRTDNEGGAIILTMAR